MVQEAWLCIVSAGLLFQCSMFQSLCHVLWFSQYDPNTDRNLELSQNACLMWKMQTIRLSVVGTNKVNNGVNAQSKQQKETAENKVTQELKPTEGEAKVAKNQRD